MPAVPRKRSLPATRFYPYHLLTKHTVAKLTSSTHRLDWENQPDPFRRYEGAERIELPKALYVSPLSYYRCLEQMMSGQLSEFQANHRMEFDRLAEELAVTDTYRLFDGGDCPEPSAADLQFLSNLLFYSMSISAWKQIVGTNHRWALRVNPSSGNLHPTDTHLLIDSIDGIESGAYHYFVREHYLEKRTDGSIAQKLWQLLTGDESCPPVIIVFTSIFWRESWKYQTRAWRYCQHDTGHALGAMLLSAAALGWRGEVIGNFPDAEVEKLLGFKGGDERPSLVIGLKPGFLKDRNERAHHVIAEQSDWSDMSFAFTGTQNALSAEEVDYPDIDAVHRATCLSYPEWQELLGDTVLTAVQKGARPPELPSVADEIDCPYLLHLAETNDRTPEVHKLIRKRRSAVDMDGKQRMTIADLAAILSSSTRGFYADFQRPLSFVSRELATDKGHFLIHLYLYIHRVDDIEPGIYYYDRIKQVLVPLVLHDQKDAARFFSCFQDIAADGCFAASMVADLNQAYRLYGDRGYRFVHYEAGFVGQWLYLSSRALGYDSTGIGCFIDDLINRHLGLEDGFEVVYNFTVGRAVDDPRLTTLPPYPFPDPSAS